MEQRLSPVAPFLPLAAEKYDPRNIEQITRALRLYFNQLDLTNQSTLSELFYLLDAKYGSFYDTTDQYAAVANTAYAVTFNSTDTDATEGVYIGSPTSRIYVPKTNVYNIQFSAQLLSNSGGTHQAWIWFRKNGTNLPDSTTQITIEGNNHATVAAWNYALSMNAGDYVELMWESSDTHIFLNADAGSAVHPAIPSVILTVTKFNT